MRLYKNSLEDFKNNYIMFIPLSIIFQSCLGSVAALYILTNASADAFPFLQLSLCVIVTMAFNAAVMAQLNYKLTFNLLLASIILNIILVALNVYLLL